MTRHEEHQQIKGVLPCGAWRNGRCLESVKVDGLGGGAGSLPGAMRTKEKSARIHKEVPLRVLRAVAVVAEVGSVTKAALILHQSASSVTRAVQEAESLLGLSLFERGARGMVPTAAGGVLALRVGRAMELLQAAAEGLRLRGAPPSAAALPRLVSDSLLSALVARATHATESAAAESLGVSQSALHQALRRLEHLARIPLFERTRVGTRLNESGRWLLMHARQAIAEIRIGHEELAHWRGLRGRRVSIGTLPMADDVLVPRASAAGAPRPSHPARAGGLSLGRAFARHAGATGARTVVRTGGSAKAQCFHRSAQHRPRAFRAAGGRSRRAGFAAPHAG